MEDTLGDLGENSGHGVIARLRILIQKLDHFQTITHELTTQEFIDQENLANDICNIQSLTKEEAKSITIVLMESVVEVVC